MSTRADNGEPVTMRVAAIFRFADGSIVFSGTLSAERPSIAPARALLLRSGEPLARIALEGEWLPDPRPATGERAVSTRDDVPVDTDTPELYTLVIEPIDPLPDPTHQTGGS